MRRLGIIVTAIPEPASFGKPLTYTVEIKNNLTCNAVDPVVFIVPLADQTPGFNELCRILSNGILPEICGAVETQE